MSITCSAHCSLETDQWVLIMQQVLNHFRQCLKRTAQTWTPAMHKRGAAGGVVLQAVFGDLSVMHHPTSAAYNEQASGASSLLGFLCKWRVSGPMLWSICHRCLMAGPQHLHGRYPFLSYHHDCTHTLVNPYENHILNECMAGQMGG